MSKKKNKKKKNIKNLRQPLGENSFAEKDTILNKVEKEEEFNKNINKHDDEKLEDNRERNINYGDGIFLEAGLEYQNELAHYNEENRKKIVCEEKNIESSVDLKKSKEEINTKVDTQTSLNNNMDLRPQSAEWSSMERKVGPFQASSNDEEILPSDIGQEINDLREWNSPETAFISDIVNENYNEKTSKLYKEKEVQDSDILVNDKKQNQSVKKANKNGIFKSGLFGIFNNKKNEKKTKSMSIIDKEKDHKIKSNSSNIKRTKDPSSKEKCDLSNDDDEELNSCVEIEPFAEKENVNSVKREHKNIENKAKIKKAENDNSHIGVSKCNKNNTMRKKDYEKTEKEQNYVQNCSASINNGKSQINQMRYEDKLVSPNINKYLSDKRGNLEDCSVDNSKFENDINETDNFYGDAIAIDEKKIDFEARIRNIPNKARQLWKECRQNAKTHVKSGVVGFSLGLCAYLLGSCTLLFDTSPLGVALLCAAPMKIIWIFSGLCLSALTLSENYFIYIFAYFTGVAVRILTRLLIDTEIDKKERDCVKQKFTDKIFCSSKSQHKNRGFEEKEGNYVYDSKSNFKSSIFMESIYLRMSTSCACALVIGLFSLISKGFQYYDLFGMIFSLICTPLAVFIYSGCFNDTQIDDKFRQMSILALLVSITYSLKDMYLIGISGGAFFAFFVTLYVCRQKGTLQGCLTGLLCGLAFSPIYAPMFALSGLTVMALWNISAFGALCAGGATALMWGFYVEGVTAMSRILPAVMISFVCYMGAQKLTFFPLAKDLLFSGQYSTNLNRLEMEKENRQFLQGKMISLSETFEGLSEIIFNFGERLGRPDLPTIVRMCDKVYDDYCPSCPNHDLCWHMEYAKSRELLDLISIKLIEKGIATSKDIPEYMINRCTALPGIISEINTSCRELFEQAEILDRTDLFALDYKTVAALIKETELENRKEYQLDKELTDKLSEVLAKYGFGEGGVCVYGSRRKKIIARGFDISGGGIGMCDLRRSIENVCNFQISEPVIEMRDNALNLKMSSKKQFSLRVTLKTDTIGEEECGDTVSSFESKDDRHYVLISDGMGSGTAAAITSGICSSFLQELLIEGNRTSSVLKLLNNFIKSKTEECSATLDLMEFDLLQGHVEFVKCGACTTFVRRGENLFKLSANTLPLGILSTVDASRLSMDMEHGDFIIMISDGIAQGMQDCIWLLELITRKWENNPKLMADKLITAARMHKSRDDISIAIIEVL